MAESGKKRRSISLFKKYISFFFAVEIICIFIFGGVLMYYVADSWEDQQKQVLLNYASNISGTYEDLLESEAAGEKISYSGLCYSISGVAQAAHSDIFITDLHGNVIFCKDMADTNDEATGKCTCKIHSEMKIPGEIYTSILNDGILATIGTMGGLYDSEMFTSATVVRDRYDAAPDGIVFAVQSKDSGLVPYLSNFLQIYIMSALVLLLITGLIIYVYTYNITKPIKQMSEATKRYAKGDFSYRIELNGKHTVQEFSELSAALNSMADDLETLEESRTNFVANVSHELKTPMTTIGGFIDGILDDTIDKEHQKYYLKIVSEEVKRLSRLVVSMLNMSKMEAGELRINPVRFALDQQLLGIFLSFEQKISDKNIKVKGLDRLTPGYIEADIDMMNQVFYNLVDNAVKFTPADGEITVDMQNNDGYVTTYIRNTGKGIDSKDIDHVFERFYKGDKSRSLDAKSTGLGLFIVKNIVNLHNGEICVKNVDDKYTEFSVKLKTKLIGV